MNMDVFLKLSILGLFIKNTSPIKKKQQQKLIIEHLEYI